MPHTIKVGGRTYVNIGVYRTKSRANQIKNWTHNPRAGIRAVVRKHKNGYAVYRN